MLCITACSFQNVKMQAGCIFYNNLLSTIFLIPLILFMGELSALMDPQIMTKDFFVVNTLAGILGNEMRANSIHYFPEFLHIFSAFTLFVL